MITFEPGRVLDEHRDRVVLGRARVDHERLAELACELHVREERALLVGAGRVVAVVVEAGLADRADGRVLGELAQPVGDAVVVAGRLVRVAADGGEHLFVLVGGRERRLARAPVHPDREDAGEAGGARLGDELGLGRRPAVEVGVAVDHSGLGNSGASLLTACPPGCAP